MRKITFVTLALAGSAALVGATTVPAFAAEPDTTTATVTVEGGALSITAPETIVLANTTVNPIIAGSSTTIGLEVSVIDARSVKTDWNSSVVLVPSANANGYTMPVNAYTYTPLEGTPSGSVPAVLSTLGAPEDLAVVTTQQSAANVNGNNTAAWDATLELAVPVEALQGTYSAVITHSVV